MISAAQIRGARALLGWSQADLTMASGIAVGSVKDIEGEATRPSPRAMIALRKAFEDAGVILLAPGDIPEGRVGVRLRKVEI